jgi:hypothetical protein
MVLLKARAAPGGASPGLRAEIGLAWHSYDYAVGHAIDPANGDVIVGASLSFPLATSSIDKRPR